MRTIFKNYLVSIKVDIVDGDNQRKCHKIAKISLMIEIKAAGIINNFTYISYNKYVYVILFVSNNLKNPT